MIPQPLSASNATAIIEHCPLPLLVVDGSGQVSGYNRAFEQLLGQLRGADMTPPMGDDPVDTLARARGTLCWCGADGRRRHLQVTCFDVPGQNALQVRIFLDISRHTELEPARVEGRQQTLTDPVTGLLNRRGKIDRWPNLV